MIFITLNYKQIRSNSGSEPFFCFLWIRKIIYIRLGPEPHPYTLDMDMIYGTGNKHT